MSLPDVLRPSSAYRNVNCPGSVVAEHRHPELVESDPAREGTAAHWVATEQLMGMAIPEVGQVAPNGVIVDDAMLEGADVWLADIDEVLRPYPHLINQLRVESRVYMPNLHPKLKGTPDAWLYIPELKLFIIWDYKYGHRFVDVFRNFQLIEYYAGGMNELEKLGLRAEDVTVEFRIIQPRSYDRNGPVRTWKIWAPHLDNYIKQIKLSAAESFGPNPRTISGEWCQDCRARHTCIAFHKSAMAAIDYVDSVTPQPLDNFSLGIEMNVVEQAFNRIEAYWKALKQDAEERIHNKQVVMGRALEPTAGHKKWNEAVEDVLTMTGLMGIPAEYLLKPPELITPTQALKKKGVDDSVISPYIDAGKPGLKLVKVTEEKIASAFTNINAEIKHHG